jgi:hypothetical protein
VPSRQRCGSPTILAEAYLSIARELSATVAQVGIAERTALAADEARVLHDKDKGHPNPSGFMCARLVRDRCT